VEVFDRGDIIVVNLEPVVGREMQGERRPALVLTTKEFNALGDVLIAPITQGGDHARFAGFAVSLMNTGCKTQGVALVNKCRMMDLTARKAKKIERAPKEVIDDALGRLMALFE
jgi:mRNA interferase ChpB